VLLSLNAPAKAAYDFFYFAYFTALVHAVTWILLGIGYVILRIAHQSRGGQVDKAVAAIFQHLKTSISESPEGGVQCVDITVSEAGAGTLFGFLRALRAFEDGESVHGVAPVAEARARSKSSRSVEPIGTSITPRAKTSSARRRRADEFYETALGKGTIGGEWGLFGSEVGMDDNHSIQTGYFQVAVSNPNLDYIGRKLRRVVIGFLTWIGLFKFCNAINVRTARVSSLISIVCTFYCAV
jgi:hypothetical protein